jgi:uncharacterized protein (UPF0548 family)
MWLMRKPSDEQVSAFLRAHYDDDFSYRELGCTRSSAPKGYNVDRNRASLGQGRSTFNAACRAMRAWTMFRLGWVDLYPVDAPLLVGTAVAIVVRHLHFWSLNAARIVYCFDERTESIERFGFAYRTLTGHAERGEERFGVEWNHQTDEVSYELFAISTPRSWAARAAYPYSRLLQKRFARDSLLVMRAAVQEESTPR